MSSSELPPKESLVDVLQGRPADESDDSSGSRSTSNGELSANEEEEILCGVVAARPAKMRKLSWKSCLCCYGGNAVRKGESLKEFTVTSWRTLHQAAEVRRDATHRFLVEQRTTLENGSLSEPKGVHHKACYRSYTSKRNRELVRNRRLTSGTDSRSASSASTTTATLGSAESAAVRVCAVICPRPIIRSASSVSGTRNPQQIAA